MAISNQSYLGSGSMEGMQVEETFRKNCQDLTPFWSWKEEPRCPESVALRACQGGPFEPWSQLWGSHMEWPHCRALDVFPGRERKVTGIFAWDTSSHSGKHLLVR